jgi:hypothetical protein
MDLLLKVTREILTGCFGSVAALELDQESSQ